MSGSTVLVSLATAASSDPCLMLFPRDVVLFLLCAVPDCGGSRRCSPVGVAQLFSVDCPGSGIFVRGYCDLKSGKKYNALGGVVLPRRRVQCVYGVAGSKLYLRREEGMTPTASWTALLSPSSCLPPVYSCTFCCRISIQYYEVCLVRINKGLQSCPLVVLSCFFFCQGWPRCNHRRWCSRHTQGPNAATDFEPSTCNSRWYQEAFHY